MVGTRNGGQRAAKKNKELYGNDFYRIIGSKGGQQKPNRPRGFAAMPKEKVVAAGRKGGRISRRTGVTMGQRKEKEYIWKGELDDELVFSQKKTKY